VLAFAASCHLLIRLPESRGYGERMRCSSFLGGIGNEQVNRDIRIRFLESSSRERPGSTSCVFPDATIQASRLAWLLSRSITSLPDTANVSRNSGYSRANE